MMYERISTLPVLRRKDIVEKMIQRKKHFPLTDVCNKLRNLEKEVSGAEEEIAAYHAPSECMDLVYRSIKRQALLFIKEAGFPTVEIFVGVLRARISQKAMYNMRITTLLIHE